MGVSGGADSVAMLHALARREDLALVVIHVDHQTRGGASAADAAFVSGLAQSLDLPLFLRTLDPTAGGESRWRRGRLAVFTEAIKTHDLDGVLLAHHADDLAETLALRLLRGNPRSGTLGLAPLQVDTTIAGVRLVRPLLGVRRGRLRGFLSRTNRPWREDVTNAQPITPRNALRSVLIENEPVTRALLRLADAAGEAEAWLEARTPTWPAQLNCKDTTLPDVLRRRAARRWLVTAGVPEAEATPAAVDRLLALLDPNGPRGCDFPGGVHVRRRKGIVMLEENLR